jgi:Nucleotide exchange factor Fes1
LQKFKLSVQQRKKWLAEAIEAMQGADPVKLMLQNIQVLLSDSSSEDDIEKKELALEDLQLHTEDIDLANGNCTFSIKLTLDLACDRLTIILSA